VVFCLGFCRDAFMIFLVVRGSWGYFLEGFLRRWEGRMKVHNVLFYLKRSHFRMSLPKGQKSFAASKRSRCIEVTGVKWKKMSFLYSFLFAGGSEQRR